MNFADKRVLITGSSRGIGRATAAAFVQRGAYVAINGRSQESVDNAIENLPNTERLVAAVGDVSTVQGCDSIVYGAIDGLGGLDILVNAAGIWSPRSIEDSDEQFWDQVLDINLKGSFFCARAALSTLRKSKGNIVNIASDAGLKGLKQDTVYCASKGGVVNMTRSMALELAPQVRVNCVCPGYVDTDMVRRDYLDKAANPELAEQEANAYAPIQRMAQPDEVANAILFLASDEAGYVTGSALQIDGGSTAG